MTEGNYTIKDSGKRQEFETGAVRDVRVGKGRFDLLPWKTIWALARHYEKGATKYSERNWEQGIPLSRFFDSAIRHAIEAFLGMRDENHLIAAIWNLVGWYETKLRIDAGILPKILDDIPNIWQDIFKEGLEKETETFEEMVEKYNSSLENHGYGRVFKVERSQIENREKEEIKELEDRLCRLVEELKNEIKKRKEKEPKIDYTG